MGNEKIRHQPWIHKDEPAEKNIVREMFFEAITIMIKRTMKLHDYQLNKEIYRQNEGGSIGMDLTGVVSDIYMLDWDEKLVQSIESEGIGVKLYKRYKDDVNIILEIQDTRIDGVTTADREMNTMEKVRILANEVDPALTVSVDYGSRYEEGRLPVIDLEIWIGKNVTGECKVLYSHYMKKVASRSTIHYRSSHCARMKKNVLINEIGRILDNCSEETLCDEAIKHTFYLVKRMQFSEYPIDLRREVVSMAMRKYGENRVATGKRKNKRLKGIQDEYQWYSENGKYNSVMFIEATPESEFKRRIQQVIRRLKMKIKVVERAGTTIKGLLQRSNPFGHWICDRDMCLICSQESEENCRTRGCVYEYTCEDCGRKYHGQTSRSIYERNKEHQESWIKKDDECPLQRHANMHHNGRHYVAELKVLAKCYGKPSRRMITESVLIDELQITKTMNAKSEWSYVKLSKMQVHGQ